MMVTQTACVGLLLLFSLPAVLAVEPNRLTETERRQGWRLLFDGETARGWVEVTGKPIPSSVPRLAGRWRTAR